MKNDEINALLELSSDENTKKQLLAEQKKVMIVAVASVIFQGAITSSMVFLNKAVLSNQHFTDISLMLFQEQIVTFIAILGLSPLFACCGIKLKLFDFKKILVIWKLSILMLLNVSASLQALTFLSVPLFNVLRRLQTLFVLILDWIFFSNKKQQWLSVVAVFIIFIGAVLSSWGDMNSNIIGIIIAVVAVALFAIQLLEANRIGNDKEDEMHPLEINQQQSFVIIPITGIVCIIKGSFAEFAANPNITHWDFWTMLVIFCLSANLLVVSQLMCTINTSALTTSIVSSVTSIIATILSLFIMNLTLTPMFISGVIIAMSGVAIYTISKVYQVRHIVKEDDTTQELVVQDTKK